MTMNTKDDPDPSREQPAEVGSDADPKGYYLRHLIEMLLRQRKPKLVETDGSTAPPEPPRPDDTN